MMFLDLGRPGGDVLAISQPAHAWISGQLLRHWATPLPETLLLAAEQHDLAWLDWERAPSFDPETRRPTLFRDVGAAAHAPIWTEAVDRARTAWGTHVALLISRHGSVIYTRFVDRHRVSDADAGAAARYVEEQGARQRAWAAALGLSPAQLDAETALIAFADMLSLALCGELAAPLEIAGANGVDYRLRGPRDAMTLDPWPFRTDTVAFDLEGRVIPGGAFDGEGSMRAWLTSSESQQVTVRLSRPPG
jgi:hypothetical protein